MSSTTSSSNMHIVTTSNNNNDSTKSQSTDSPAVHGNINHNNIFNNDYHTPNDDNKDSILKSILFKALFRPNVLQLPTHTVSTTTPTTTTTTTTTTTAPNNHDMIGTGSSIAAFNNAMNVNASQGEASMMAHRTTMSNFDPSPSLRTNPTSIGINMKNDSETSFSTTTSTETSTPRNMEGLEVDGDDDNDEEEYVDVRPHIQDGAVFTMVYVMAIFIVLFRWMVMSIILSIEDGYWARCAWFIFFPIYMAMAMFPFRIAIYNVLTLFGAWRHIYRNSTYHSYTASPIPNVLPSMCVQMPVYKESFKDTIQPSLESIQKAIDHYRQRGGEVFMFINDDGLMLLNDTDRDERLQYYQVHNIAYVARPSPTLLPRYGLFKKASNMNFCLNFAHDVEQVELNHPNTTINSSTGLSKDEAIKHVVASRDYPVMAGGPINMANVGYILLVDSDTRVPEVCLYATVGEFYLNSTVGFIQHATSVLRVDYNYWEDILAHFTYLLYSVFIPMGTALGEPSPLVGHNATLNWKAVQEVSWYDDDVGYRKYWSESHVSEDFDMSIRLQSHGYIGRYAMYTGDGFQEGVSVTVHDEIKKLKKFAFGSGEMLFHPFKDWLCKGPVSPLIWTYLCQSSTPLHARINLVAYLFTYVAMAFGVLSFPQLFFVAVMDSQNQNLPSPWEIVFGTILIFAIIGSGNIIILTFFLGHHTSLWLAMVYEMKHLIPLGVFYTGIQYHIFTSFFRYMCSLKAEWGATVKELGDADLSIWTFFREVRTTVWMYWDMYLYVIAMVTFFVFFFLYGPDYLYWSGYAMSLFCVFMAGQVFMPIVLNPTAMRPLYMPFLKFFRFC